MELFLELLLTAVISLIFAFFLAKIVSLASSSDHDRSLAESVFSTADLSKYSVPAENERSRSIQELHYSEEHQTRVVEEFEVLMKENETEMKSDGQDNPIFAGTSSESRLVKEEEEIGKDCGEKSAESALSEGGMDRIAVERLEVAMEEKRFELDGQSGSDFAEEVVNSPNEAKGEKRSGLDGRSPGELAKKVVNSPEEAKEEEKPEIGGEASPQLVEEAKKHSKDGYDAVNLTASPENIEKDKGSLIIDEEEWEGIERSELEKKFGVLASLVASESGEVLSKVGSDLQMQLYGLHKIATEGPCHEPQPSVLKVSARAKWHAWQQLGNMTPEVAMEKYINLLYDRIPGLNQDNRRDNKCEGADDSLEAHATGSKSPDLSSSTPNLMSSENERNAEETRPSIPNDDMIGGFKSMEQGNSAEEAI